MIGWAIRQSIKRKLQPVTHAVKLQVSAVKIKATKGKKKAKKVKRKFVHATRNTILPLLPGVSKLKLPTSPVGHLLLSNDPPTDAERALARHVILEVVREEERMKAKLFVRSLGSDLSYWTTVTRHKVEQTSAFIELHRGIVSPLRKFPAEIMQEIFLWVSYPRTHTRWTSSADIPWALGQVCRSWRENALGLSALWSHLPTMDLSKSDPRSRTRSQLEYLEELLRRSRSAPLDIYLFSLGFTGTSHPVIDLLLANCERWHTVTIKTNISILPCLREVKGRLPNLETLSLYLSGYGDSVPTIDMFEGAPSLRQVDVGGPFLADLALPFSQLAHYKDKMRMRNSITRVVTAANSLEALTILELCESSGTPPIPAVTLPSLRKLQVKFCCTRPDFLNNLIIPAIEEIKMVSYHDRGSLIPTLINIIGNSESPCRLQCLRFRTQAVQPGQLPTLLQLTPHLTHLDMPIPPATDLSTLADQLDITPGLNRCEFFINDLFGTAHDSELAASLNALATSRCPNSGTTHFDSIPPRNLEKLMLHFDRSRWVPMLKSCLEGWRMSPASESLRTLKLMLHEELPELESCRSRRVRKFERKWVDKVKEIMIGIEGFDIADVGDVYVSEMHLSLKSLSERRVGWDSRYRFADRAKKILDVWEPHFRKGLPNLRWMLKGDNGMTYVPQNDEVRHSPDALNSLLYGVPDTMSYRTAFWPIYMN